MKPKKAASKPPIVNQADLVSQGVKELKIDVPIMRYEFRKDHITFYLYGGGVVIFPVKRHGAA